MATLRQELELDAIQNTDAAVLWHDETAPRGSGIAASWEGARRPQLALKRALDVAGALLLGALLLIPAALTALIVRLDSEGPVLLRQIRVGGGGRLFVIYKFRTMCVNAEAMLPGLKSLNEQQGPLFKMRRDPRMTRIGRWLRKTSIDEVPQLINVLRGEMSLVGPRPPLPHEVRKYTSHELGRLAMKPGMTGLWQVRGRSTLTFDQMVDLDIEYIEAWSLARDLLILARTLPAVISTRGAY